MHPTTLAEARAINYVGTMQVPLTIKQDLIVVPRLGINAVLNINMLDVACGIPLYSPKHQCVVWFAKLPTGCLFPIRIQMLPDAPHASTLELISDDRTTLELAESLTLPTD